MTSREIHSFIQRLLRRELKDGELLALTTRDLGEINLHIAKYGETDLCLSTKILSATEQPPKCTCSEEEILLEFGVLE